MTERFKKWDSVEYLTNEALIANYLLAALEENDLEFFGKCFKTAVRAYHKHVEPIDNILVPGSQE